MKNLVLLCSCLFFLVNGMAQSKTIQTLKKEEAIRTGYYLYPSTIRMLNLNDDPEINRLIKDVRKLSLLNMRPDKFDKARMQSTVDALQQQEAMETFLEIRNDSMHVLLLGNEYNKQLITIAKMQEEYFIAELEGTLNLGVVPKLIESFNNRDTSQNNGFAMIFDALNQDIDRRKYWEKRREERRKKREEKEKEKSQPTENTPADSTLRKDSLKKEPIKGPKS